MTRCERVACDWFDFASRVFLSGTAGFNAVLLSSRDNNRVTTEDVRKALYRRYGFEVKLDVILNIRENHCPD